MPQASWSKLITALSKRRAASEVDCSISHYTRADLQTLQRTNCVQLGFFLTLQLFKQMQQVCTSFILFLSKYTWLKQKSPPSDCLKPQQSHDPHFVNCKSLLVFVFGSFPFFMRQKSQKYQNRNVWKRQKEWSIWWKHRLSSSLRNMNEQEPRPLPLFPRTICHWGLFKRSCQQVVQLSAHPHWSGEPSWQREKKGTGRELEREKEKCCGSFYLSVALTALQGMPWEEDQCRTSGFPQFIVRS